MAKSVLLFLRKILSLPFIALIHFYRLCISPLIGPQCRYLPTCSSYALESYRRYGVIKGSYLSLRRLSRCHPWCKGGCDPVP